MHIYKRFVVLIVLGLLTISGVVADPSPQKDNDLNTFPHAISDGKPLPIRGSRMCKEGFYADLYLTVDPLRFCQQWASVPSSGTPNMAGTTTHLVKRNMPVSFLVLIANPKLDNSSNADVSYTINIKKPDGKMELPQDTWLWKGKYLAPPKGCVLCGMNVIRYAVDDTAPSGRYSVEAIVKDNNRQVELPLQSFFIVD